MNCCVMLGRPLGPHMRMRPLPWPNVTQMPRRHERMMPWPLPHEQMRLRLRRHAWEVVAVIASAREKEDTTVPAACTDEFIATAPHMEEAATTTAHAAINAWRAYESMKDLIYADKDIDPSFHERILQGAGDYFTINAIELKEAPTMENSGYKYFNHCSSSDEDE